MQINKNNYELFAIDYIEGKLTGDALRQMQRFLAENPDIKAEFEGLNLMVLPKTENVSFNKKNVLLQPETKSLWRWIFPTMSIVLFVGLILIGFWNMYSTEKENNNILRLSKKPAVSADLKTTNTDVHQNIITTNTTKTVVEEKKPIPSTPKKISPAPAKIKASDANEKPSPASEFKAPTVLDFKTDSLKNILDSLQQLNNKPKIQLNAMPMASVDLQEMTLKTSDIELNTAIATSALSIDFNHQEPSEAPAPRPEKSMKTPFGKIKFNDIRDALLPESYIAATK
jgi:cytoskeletal protein RodZ